MKTRRADDLLGELSDILKRTREQGSLGPVVVDQLEEAMRTADLLASQLAEVQGMVVLVEVRQDDLDMDAARGLWETLDVDRSLTGIQELISLSPTLSALHKAAVSIESAHRFSDERIRLASTIAELTASCPQYVSMLHDGRPQASASFSIRSDAVDAMSKVLRALEQAGATQGFSIKGQVKPKGGKPFWVPIEKHKFPKSAGSWIVNRGAVASEFAAFLDGDWLTAYAYGIARDQFLRDGQSFEIYSKVQYRLPADLGGGQSDIDVLIRTADLLLCIECKSGKVLVEHHGHESAAAKTRAAAERLDEILDEMGVQIERVYQLLYLHPPGEEPDQVREAIAHGAVPLLVANPAQERRLMQRAALGNLDLSEELGE